MIAIQFLIIFCLRSQPQTSMSKCHLSRQEFCEFAAYDSCVDGKSFTAYSDVFNKFIEDSFNYYCFKKITLNIPKVDLSISDDTQFRIIDSFLLKLSALPELEEVIINNYTLEKFPPSIELLVRITKLSIINSDSLICVNVGAMSNLTLLEIINCNYINQEAMWSNITELQNLRYLYLNRIGLAEVPRSIKSLSKLNYLSIDENQGPVFISKAMFNLEELKCLSYHGTKLAYSKQELLDEFGRPVVIIDK